MKLSNQDEQAICALSNEDFLNVCLNAGHKENTFQGRNYLKPVSTVGSQTIASIQWVIAEFERRDMVRPYVIQLPQAVVIGQNIYPFDCPEIWTERAYIEIRRAGINLRPFTGSREQEFMHYYHEDGVFTKWQKNTPFAGKRVPA